MGHRTMTTRRFCFGALLNALRLLAMCAFALSAVAQQSNIVVQPDVSFNFGPLTATGTVQYPVSTWTMGIKYWRFSYQSTGFTGVSIQLEAAPDSFGSPGTWVIFPGSAISGTNPQTSTAGGLTSFSVTPNIVDPWIRINLTSAVGTGAVQGRVMGYRVNPDGGSGSGCPGTSATPCDVQGVTATGAAATENPLLDGALDGSGNKAPFVLGTTPTVISLSSSGLTQIIGLSAGKSIRVTHISIAFASAVNFQLEYGTGTNCGTGTTALTGTYQDILTYTMDWDLDPLIVPSGNALCANLGAAVTGGGLAKSALF
jgi:hypothetical protein